MVTLKQLIVLHNGIRIATPEENESISKSLFGEVGLFDNVEIHIDEVSSSIQWDMDGMQYGSEFIEVAHQAFVNLLDAFDQALFVDFVIYTISIQLDGLQDGS